MTKLDWSYQKNSKRCRLAYPSSSSLVKKRTGYYKQQTAKFTILPSIWNEKLVDATHPSFLFGLHLTAIALDTTCRLLQYLWRRFGCSDEVLFCLLRCVPMWDHASGISLAYGCNCWFYSEKNQSQKLSTTGEKRQANAYEMAWKTNKQKFQQFLSWTNGLMKRWWKKKRKKAELWKYFLAEIHNKRCIIAIINPLAGCNIHLLIWL